MVRLRVRIVGGSLAGLFVATLLKREGHDVRIYERSVRGLDGRGAGLLGKKETFAILRAAGCEHVARVSVIARERLTFDETGAVVDRSMAPQSQLSWDYLYRTFRDFIAGDDWLAEGSAAHIAYWAGTGLPCNHHGSCEIHERAADQGQRPATEAELAA